MGPAFMPSTSAPASGGLGYDDVAALFRALSKAIAGLQSR